MECWATHKVQTTTNMHFPKRLGRNLERWSVTNLRRSWYSQHIKFRRSRIHMQNSSEGLGNTQRLHQFCWNASVLYGTNWNGHLHTATFRIPTNHPKLTLWNGAPREPPHPPAFTNNNARNQIVVDYFSKVSQCSGIRAGRLLGEKDALSISFPLEDNYNLKKLFHEINCIVGSYWDR